MILQQDSIEKIITLLNLDDGDNAGTPLPDGNSLGARLKNLNKTLAYLPGFPRSPPRDNDLPLGDHDEDGNHYSGNFGKTELNSLDFGNNISKALTSLDNCIVYRQEMADIINSSRSFVSSLLQNVRREIYNLNQSLKLAELQDIKINNKIAREDDLFLQINNRKDNLESAFEIIADGENLPSYRVSIATAQGYFMSTEDITREPVSMDRSARVQKFVELEQERIKQDRLIAAASKAMGYYSQYKHQLEYENIDASQKFFRGTDVSSGRIDAIKIEVRDTKAHFVDALELALSNGGALDIERKWRALFKIFDAEFKWALNLLSAVSKGMDQVLGAKVDPPGKDNLPVAPEGYLFDCINWAIAATRLIEETAQRSHIMAARISLVDQLLPRQWEALIDAGAIEFTLKVEDLCPEMDGVEVVRIGGIGLIVDAPDTNGFWRGSVRAPLQIDETLPRTEYFGGIPSYRGDQYRYPVQGTRFLNYAISPSEVKEGTDWRIAVEKHSSDGSSRNDIVDIYLECVLSVVSARPN